MDQGTISGDYASVKFTGANPAVITASKNVLSAVRTAKGRVTVTLADGIDKSNRVEVASALGTTGASATIDEASGTDNTIFIATIDNTGADIDSGASLIVSRSAIG